MRIICGKFLRRNNKAEYQSFYSFLEYSENYCGVCHHKGGCGFVIHQCFSSTPQQSYSFQLLSVATLP